MACRPALLLASIVFAPRLVALALASLVACGGAVRGADALEGGPPTGPAGSEDAPAPGADDANTGADTSATGSKFDVAGSAEEGGAAQMPTCDTLDEDDPTSLGCEFWAADLLAFGAAHGLGVGVGNPWDVEVTVAIEDRQGPGGAIRTLAEITLAPRTSEILEVTGSASALVPDPIDMFEGARDVHVGTNPAVAFRVRADLPITAMQINPMGGAASWVPEASMLLPSNALRDVHLALGYTNDGGESWVVVIATVDGTEVTTEQGSVQLDAFDAVMYLMTDATGFRVDADQPVAVFSGASGAYVPPTGGGWSNHLEEQVLPLAAWGTRYVGARHPQRVPEFNPGPEPVVWRVVAALDDTAITLTPAQPGVGDAIHLAEAGGFVEFATADSFVAESDPDTPFMLVQYMTGGERFDPDTDCAPGRPVGDPYMLQSVPIDQWLSRLPFATDVSYARDFVVIARPLGAAVELACLGPIPDDRFMAIAGSDYEVATIDLDIDHGGGEGDCKDGQQFISAAAPVGIFVGGVDCAASYGYPGGLSVSGLWTPPAG